tara:strand:+ start:31278 stop:32906 length:1629 start_codon:yes stop_codon:yes gene_type:complete
MKMVMTFVMAYEFDYKPSYRRKLTAWHRDAQEFIKRFRLAKRPIDAAYKAIMQEVDPNEDDRLHENIDAVVSGIQEKKDVMKKELDLRREDITLLNDLRLIQTKESAAAYRRLSKVVSRFGDPDINTLFVEDHEDTNEEQSELETLVEKYTGSSGLQLPIPVLQQWQEVAKKRGEKLKDHKRYLELRRALNQSFKTRLQSLVRSSGKPYLPVREVAEKLKDEGIPHTLPTGFVGMIDDAGKFYTTEGRKLVQAPAGEVRMNPAYDAKKDNAYVCEFTPPGGQKPARAYTENFRSQSKTKKFSVVGDTMPKMNTLAKKWRQDMRDTSKRSGVLATLVEFIYDTSARAGNPNAESKGQRTFGATQLQAKHFHVDDHKITVTYQGKSGGKQKHVIQYTKSNALKLLAKNLKALLKGKKGTDTVFEFNGKGFTSTTVSRYMASIGFPKGFTIHKLRTARGTLMATKVLKQSPFKKDGDWTERDVNQWVEARMLEIGKELGHMSGEKYTSNTAIQNYIAPEVLADFYTKLGIRPPAKIQKAIDSTKA